MSEPTVTLPFDLRDVHHMRLNEPVSVVEWAEYEVRIYVVTTFDGNERVRAYVPPYDCEDVVITATSKVKVPA